MTLRPSLPGRRRVGVALLTLTLAAALAVVVAGQLWLRAERSDDDTARAAREAAERAVTAALSYDYRRLADGRADTEPLLTGDAAEQYAEVLDPLARSAPRLHAVVVAEVKTATILDARDDAVEVLLFVDQVADSNKLSEPQLDQSRVVVTVVREGERWLVSTLRAV
jgi:Mce-associated membrane protein